MGRPVAGELVGQFGIIDRMGVGGIEADQLALGTDQYKSADVAGFCKLVGGATEKVVDLLNATGKSRSIVLGRIERLYNDRLCVSGRGHQLVIVSRWRAKAVRSRSVGAGGVSSAAKKLAWSTGSKLVRSCAAIVSIADR